MKLTIFMLFVAFMQVNAASMAQQLTLKQKNVPISRVFDEIKKQTGYDVFYLPKVLNTSKKINADFDNTPLTGVMEILLKDQPATFTIDDKTIVIRERRSTAIPDYPTGMLDLEMFLQQPITGRVTDAVGNPLFGATVSIKGGKSTHAVSNGS